MFNIYNLRILKFQMKISVWKKPKPCSFTGYSLAGCKNDRQRTGTSEKYKKTAKETQNNFHQKFPLGKWDYLFRHSNLSINFPLERTKNLINWNFWKFFANGIKSPGVDLCRSHPYCLHLFSITITCR